MSKKRGKPAAPSGFAVGDHVRVKQGIRDADYPDMPLGGWVGTISEIHDDGIFTVCWSRETLDNIHPVYKMRCERDGAEEDWIGHGDLEPDPGGPLAIEQPTEISTKPLSSKDQDDRIRMVFGLTSNDPLPDVEEEMLLKYHDYLSKNMSFPFEMNYFRETGPFEGSNHVVRVMSLLDPEKYSVDEMYGLICRVKEGRKTFELPLGEFETDAKEPNKQLLADYCYWFCNWR